MTLTLRTLSDPEAVTKGSGLIKDEIDDNVIDLLARVNAISDTLDALALQLHNPNEDTKLDEGQPNEVTAVQLKLSLLGLGGSSTLTITELADFPAPAANVITLVTGQIYKVEGFVNIGANRIVTNGALLYGDSEDYDGIISTTGDTLLTCTNVNFESYRLKYTCTSGTFLDFTGTGVEKLLLGRVEADCQTAGTIASVGLHEITKCRISPTTNGILYTLDPETINTVLMTETVFTGLTTTGKYIDFGTSGFNSCFLKRVLCAVPTGVTFLSGLADSENFVEELSVTDCVFDDSGGGSILENINVHDIKANFRNNRGLEETMSVGEIYIDKEAGTTVTVIDSQDEEKQLLGTWLEEVAQRFTCESGGDCDHDGLEPRRFSAKATLTCQVAGGANKEFDFYFAIDNVLIEASRTNITLDGSIPTPLTMQSNLLVSNGETVNIWCINRGGNQNVTLQAGNMVLD